MAYTIKKSKFKTWRCARGCHNVAPRVKRANRLLQDRFDPDAKYRAKDEKDKSITAMAEFTEVLGNPAPIGEDMVKKVFDFLDVRGKDLRKAELLNIIKEFVCGCIADVTSNGPVDYTTLFTDIAIELDEKYEKLYQ